MSPLNNKKNWSQCFGSGFEYYIFIKFIQMISHVFIVCLKHYYVNTLNFFTTLILFSTLKHENV
jgi:hypothetical protein